MQSYIRKVKFENGLNQHEIRNLVKDYIKNNNVKELRELCDKYFKIPGEHTYNFNVNFNLYLK